MDASRLHARTRPGAIIATTVAVALTLVLPSAALEQGLPPSRPLASAIPSGSPGPSAVPSASLPSGASPMPSVAPVRPDLAEPLDASGPPSYRPQGDPSATAEAGGVRVELWVRDTTLRQGQWLRTYLRVTNIGDRRLRRICEGLDFRADVSSLFDPGESWTGVADTFKQQWLAESGLVSLRARLRDYRPSSGRCRGDMGRALTLRPGDSIGGAFVAMPRYGLRGQPLPGGTFSVSAGYRPDVGPRAHVIAPVTVAVELEGADTFRYPSPGQLADTALREPAFLDFLERYPDPAGWANTGTTFWPRQPYPPQPRLDPARGAPDGILDITLYTNDLNVPWVGGVVVDPWTGESLGAYTE